MTIAGLACGLLQSKASFKRVKGEWYPLSTYPMYSNFSGRDYYLYLADAAGEPVPCMDFGISAPKLKKKFKALLKAADLKESELRERRLPPQHLGPIAATVLEEVAAGMEDRSVLGPGEELTLQLALIWREGGKIETKVSRIGGIELK